ncbi:MAG TPA: response regulator [Thermoanaerobaculia bacterium]|nr:response regulator [Thermoanaerobaculia bacterium]
MNASRVLIVDDDPAIRQIIATVLRRDGIAVDIAVDGEAAVALLQRESYGVIVLDLLMPRVNGLEVIDFMKAHAINTPVIVLSAVTDDHVPDLDPQLVRVAMQKPLEPRELRRVVEAILERTA